MSSLGFSIPTASLALEHETFPFDDADELLSACDTSYPMDSDPELIDEGGYLLSDDDMLSEKDVADASQEISGLCPLTTMDFESEDEAIEDGEGVGGLELNHEKL